MGEMSIFDILLALKKRLQTIIAFVIVFTILSFFVAQLLQTYTATLHLQYKFELAGEGLAPDESKLNVYEIMNPAIISSALRELDLGLDITVEEIRNQMSITEVVDSTTTEIQKASTEKGEEFIVNPTEYTVSYTFDGSYGSEFGNRLLYAIVKAYDEQFAENYYNMTNIANFMDNVNLDDMDYMPACEFIETNLNNIIESLEGLQEGNETYRSVNTGLDFATLKSYFESVKSTDYDKYYSNVRAGLLTKDKEKLIKSYQNKIESAQLSMQTNQKESDLSHEMVSQFYDQYKKSALYKQAVTTQGSSTGSNSENKTLVYDEDLSKNINTYDEMMVRYVNTGTEASNLRHDSEYYQQLITAFQNDGVDPGDKLELLAINENIMKDMRQRISKYTALANKTLADFYGGKTSQDIIYLMAVAVTPNVSVSLVVALGFAIGLAVISVICIFLEMFKQNMEKKKLAALAADSPHSHITPEIIDGMNSLERAFYEQTLQNFNEFYLQYQPVVDMEFNWVMAETLVRWDSARLGRVMPDEFLPIAEKFGLLDVFGVWIFSNACLREKEWEKEGLNHMISVNYSVSQIESDSFVDSLCQVISKTKIAPEKICFEISGGGEIDDIQYVAQKFVALKAIGAQVAVDRFGDTLSSLRVLYDIPEDIVKISRMYISDLENFEKTSFLNDTIALCKEQKLKICMLGVENTEQIRRLKELKVDYMQGYYFSSPLSAEEYTLRLLSAHSVPKQEQQEPEQSGETIDSEEAEVPQTEAEESQAAVEPEKSMKKRVSIKVKPVSEAEAKQKTDENSRPEAQEKPEKIAEPAETVSAEEGPVPKAKVKLVKKPKHSEHFKGKEGR